VASRSLRIGSLIRWLLWPALGIGAVLIVLAPILWLQTQVQQPYKRYSESEILVQLERGATVSEIGKILEAEGVIASARLFRLYAHWHNLSTGLKAGEYQFSKAESLADVVAKIAAGRVYYHRVTVPEGLELAQVASVFVESEFGSMANFLSIMHDTGMITDLDSSAESLEGYLFPETYFLTAGMTEREIVELMLQNFRAFWNQKRKQRANELKMTIREILTLASLIEKETGLESERPLVSAVFHNRLRINMKLACDPTVIYAVKRVKPYDGVINKSDLELDSPYNTYLYPGLPPGPIANPGRLAIEAALYPADSEYLYFVSRNDGSHIFSTRYSDHAKAVNRYQR